MMFHKKINFKIYQLFFLGCFLSWQVAHAQDTIFYNAIWETCASAEASYFRTIDKTNPLLVRDYYKSGILQMQGTFTDTTYEIEKGAFEYYHPNGKLSKTCTYVQAEMNGEFKEYHPNGNLKTEGYYIIGKLSGTSKEYDSTGYLLSETPYKKGKIDGEVLWYFPSGNIRRKELYQSGVKKNKACFTEAGLDTTYYPHITYPYIGSENFTMYYLEELIYMLIGKNVNYPVYCKENGIEGKVKISFIINVEGKIDNLEVIYSKHEDFTKEVLHAMKLMPTFTPGTYEGVQAPIPVTLPILFSLK